MRLFLLARHDIWEAVLGNKEAYLGKVLAGEEKLLFDGAMGSLLQSRDLLIPGQNPDDLVFEKPDAITEIHRNFVEAGSQVATSNTFRSNRAKLGDKARLRAVMEAAFECANAAKPMFIAADIGPTGEMLEPYGDLSENEALDIFADTVKAIEGIGYDMILIETLTDVNEAELAVRAAKENSSLPVFASMSFQAGGRTMFGSDAASSAKALVNAGADCLGMNCSVGPQEATAIVAAMREAVEVPIICQPNAGLPRLEDGRTVYDVSPKDFCDAMKGVIEAGATIIGGCCGTTPDFIRALSAII